MVISDPSFVNVGTIAGGAGGVGGTATGTGSAGEGGTGGHGIHFLNAGSTLANNGTILAGSGGDSGGGRFPEGGSGGVGVRGPGLVVTNNGAIAGGAGGDGGRGFDIQGSNGGAGIVGLGGAALTVTNNGGATIAGGNGGAALGDPAATGSNNGGFGGIGISATTVIITNDGTITGGNGGTGTMAGSIAGTGGSGGAGITAVNGTITNTVNGTITGGNGAVGPILGIGGAGITGGPGLTVINDGSIVGGLNGDGSRAKAITFAGGSNILELQPNFEVIGNVVASDTNNTFRLGGIGAQTFDVSKIGPVALGGQYQGFDAFVMAGPSTWTLTGAPLQATPWTIAQGTLVISADSNLGVSNELLTFNSNGMSPAPTLRFGAPDITVARDVQLLTTGTFDTAGNTATISGDMFGAGGVDKIGAGTLILSGANTYSGTTTIFEGTLQAGAANTFSPNSVHNVTSTGILDLAGFSQTIAGAINAGSIFTNGAGPSPSTTLTVNGNYFGANGILGLNTFLGADSSPSDRLVINGGTATGLTFINIANVGGLGALTTGSGILVVDAIGGALTDDAFRLAGPVIAGPFEYMLFKGNDNPEAWYLRSTINCALPGAPAELCPAPPEPPPCPVPPSVGPTPTPTPPAPTPPEVPNFRQEVSLYSAIPSVSLAYGRALIDTLHERVGTETRADVDPAKGPHGAWGRVIAEHGERDGGCPSLVGPTYDYGFAAVQAGFDAVRLQHLGGARDRAGVYGAIGDGHSDVTHVTGLDAGRNTFAAYSTGAYWTHYGAWGWYLDGVVQGTWYDVEAQSTRLPALETDGWGFAASLESGYPFKGLLGGWGSLGGWTVEPQAQLVYQAIDLGNARDIAAQVRFDDVESLAGRLGVRFATSWAMPGGWGLSPAVATVWLRPSYWHELSDDARTLFSSEIGFLPFRANLWEDWVELNAGLTTQVGPNTSLYASASYDIDVEGDGEAWDGKVGLKVRW